MSISLQSLPRPLQVSKMESFATKVSDLKPLLTVVAKLSMLDVLGGLATTLPSGF